MQIKLAKYLAILSIIKLHYTEKNSRSYWDVFG